MRDKVFKQQNKMNISNKKMSLLLALILLFSLCINFWGNKWGAPDKWHPDEITSRASSMTGKLSVNPHFFAYGGLHYLVIGAGAVIPARAWSKLFDPIDSKSDKNELLKRHQRLKARIMVFARSISAIMATLIVFFTFWLGKLLFDRWVGLLAALFLSLTCYFIAIAHFATVDMAANFWYWLSCLMAALLWKRDEKVWYFLAFLAGGLALGTKVDRLIIVIPLLLAHFFRGPGLQIKLLLKYAPLLLIGYLIANPTFILSPFEFLDGTTRETFFNILRDDTSSTSFMELTNSIKSGLGIPLFFSALFGVVFALYHLTRKKNIPEIVWLVVTILPYYFLFGSRVHHVWYTPFFFPALVILAAYGYFNLSRIMGPKFNIVALLILLTTIVYSAVYSIALVNQFSHDSRYLASQWVVQQIPSNAKILISPRGPKISSSEYRVVHRPGYLNFDSYNFAKQWSDRLTNNKIYQIIRKEIFELEKLTARQFGTNVRSHPYQAWFDRALKPQTNNSQRLTSWDELLTQRFDYIILVDYLDQKMIDILSADHPQYRLVKIVHYETPFYIDINFPFVNPKIFIFQRSDGVNKNKHA